MSKTFDLEDAAEKLVEILEEFNISLDDIDTTFFEGLDEDTNL